MNLMEINTNEQHIVLVMGKLCSGKDYYCQSYINKGYFHITTSDVVKRVSGKTSRSELQKTQDFDTQIVEELISIIEENPKIIIDGIRQLTILNAIESKYPTSSIKKVWLEVPDDIRQTRFNSRNASKDDRSFEDSEVGDQKLGLGDVENYVKGDGSTDIHHNYDK